MQRQFRTHQTADPRPVSAQPDQFFKIDCQSSSGKYELIFCTSEEGVKEDSGADRHHVSHDEVHSSTALNLHRGFDQVAERCRVMLAFPRKGKPDRRLIDLRIQVLEIEQVRIMVIAEMESYESPTLAASYMPRNVFTIQCSVYAFLVSSW